MLDTVLSLLTTISLVPPPVGLLTCLYIESWQFNQPSSIFLVFFSAFLFPRSAGLELKLLDAVADEVDGSLIFSLILFINVVFFALYLLCSFQLRITASNSSQRHSLHILEYSWRVVRCLDRSKTQKQI